MTYSQKINKLFTNYKKDFKRADQTFEMIVVKSIVKELENETYDKSNYSEYSKEEIEAICKYLFERYILAMKNWYQYLSSDEYKNKKQYI